MTPATFNAQLAEHKLESIRLLLIQAKKGSDADRIRAASAIVRIPFIKLDAPRKAAPPARGEGPPLRGERSSTKGPQESPASAPVVPTPDSPKESAGERTHVESNPSELPPAPIDPMPATPSASSTPSDPRPIPDAEVWYDTVTGRRLLNTS